MIRIAVLFVCFACVLFTSCGTDTATVSDEEALAAGKKLEAMIKSGDVEGITVFFDAPSFYGRIAVMSRAAQVPKVMNEFKSAKSITLYAKRVILAAKNGDFRYVRSSKYDEGQRLLFRVFSLAGGINYHEFFLEKVKTVVKIVNARNYEMGDVLTIALADHIDLIMQGNDKVTLFMKKKNEGDLESMKALYMQMPAEIQEKNGVLLAYIEACQRTSDSNYKAAAEKYFQLYPVSGGSCLLMIDVSIRAKEYDKALHAVDNLETIVGGDPFLNFVRGNIYLLMEDPAKSISYYEKVYAYDPELVMNMQALIAIYMKENETDKAKKVVETYKASKVFDQKVLDLLNGKFPALLK